MKFPADIGLPLTSVIIFTQGAYSEADAARLLYEVASALAFLHGVGVIHADLKPENLLLCSKNRRDGTIKVIDFGCAVIQEGMDTTGKTSAASPTNSTADTGTTGYWPPERFLAKPITPAVDMWAVGVILYIMLTGKVFAWPCFEVLYACSRRRTLLTICYFQAGTLLI